jgi:hypothetical protein
MLLLPLESMNSKVYKILLEKESTMNRKEHLAEKWYKNLVIVEVPKKITTDAVYELKTADGKILEADFHLIEKTSHRDTFRVMGITLLGNDFVGYLNTAIGTGKLISLNC